MNAIRLLYPDEIDVRVQEVKEKYVKLLLYKDARCDMRILDETFGIDGWKRTHQTINGNLYCTVSVWSDRLNQWIEKQDVGTESNAEAEKGQASDSFKRACFNLGIGRELYTPIDIKIWANDTDIQSYKGKYKLGFKEKFSVKSLTVDRGKIVALVIINQNGKTVFTYSNQSTQQKKQQTTKEPVINADQVIQIIDLVKDTKTNLEDLLAYCKIKNVDSMTQKMFNEVYARLQVRKAKQGLE